MLAPLLPVPDVGVAWADPPSRNDAEMGVGAWDPGVEPKDPGVAESWKSRRVSN